MSREKTTNGSLSCSFCGKSQKEVKKLIAGPGVYICDECIDLCNDIISEEKEREDNSNKTVLKVPKPVDIKSHLDDYVIGQEGAKRSLAVAVHNHYKRINSNKNKKKDEIEISKLIGATDSFIHRPFLYFGTIQGLAGGIAAWLIVTFFIGALNEELGVLAGLYEVDIHLQHLSLQDSLSLLLFSAWLGWLGARISVANHLWQIEPR